MLSINKVMVTGRLTRDVEIRYLPSGNPVANFSIAVNRRYLDPKTNEWRDETTFLDVEAWGKLAERCGEVLKKGRPVYVEGRLRQDTWERDNQKQSRIRIVAERVAPFDVPSRADGEPSADLGEPAEGPSKPAGGTPPSSAPSNGLDFSASNNVEDDIPF